MTPVLRASLAPRIPAGERGVKALLCIEGDPAEVRDLVCSFPPGFLPKTGRWGMVVSSLLPSLELFSGPAASIPGKEPLPTTAPTETSPPSPCTPLASQAAPPLPPAVIPRSFFPWEIAREVRGGWGCSKLRCADKKVEEKVLFEPKLN